MKYAQWIDVKNAAIVNNRPTLLTYKLINNFYIISISIGGNVTTCKVKNTSEEAQDFITNYLPNLTSDVDDTGKQYVAPYSGNQTDETIVFTTRGDTTNNIGDGDTTKFLNSDFINNIKTIYTQFNSDYRILKGNIVYTGGDIGCYGDCYIVAPAGAPIIIAGQLFTFEEEIEIHHFVIEQICMSDTYDNTINFKGERATDLIPSFYPIKTVWTKSEGNTTFSGFIRYSIYRGSSV